MGGRGDEQVHAARARPASGAYDRRRELSIAGGHGVVDRQWVEAALEAGEQAYAAGPLLVIARHQHAKVDLRDAHGRYRELVRQRRKPARDEDARVEDRSHRSNGSLSPWSRFASS